MKIEAGKLYRRRDGQRAGPMVLDYDQAGDNWHDPKGDHYYPDSGFWLRSETHDYDLISEWTDEPTGPVITETVKRIKPGVYGIVQVVQPPPHNALGSCVQICLNYNGKHVPHLWVTAPELRAAAATLTEIAEALEEMAS